MAESPGRPLQRAAASSSTTSSRSPTSGLIKSVDGFDAARGVAFTSYAIPMILGELKRHFRDRTWDVRVPRRLQELRLEISEVYGTLAQTLGRSPTVADLAAPSASARKR